jgi:hypothetical protein
VTGDNGPEPDADPRSTPPLGTFKFATWSAKPSAKPDFVPEIRDPLAPEVADLATLSRPGRSPVTAAPPNSPSTSAPIPRVIPPPPPWPLPMPAPLAAKPPAKPPAADMPMSCRSKPCPRPPGEF